MTFTYWYHVLHSCNKHFYCKSSLIIALIIYKTVIFTKIILPASAYLFKEEIEIPEQGVNPFQSSLKRHQNEVIKVVLVSFIVNFEHNSHPVKQYIDDVSKKISKGIGVFYKSRGIVKQSVLKQLYFSLIPCHLNYTNIALASTYESKLEEIHRHQKQAARIINFRIDLPMHNHYSMT